MFHEASPDRGTLVLSKLRDRPIDHPVVQKEKDEILAAIALESGEEGTWMDLLRNGGTGNCKRFFLAVGAQFMQQTSGRFTSDSMMGIARFWYANFFIGINIVSYYAPTIFQQSLGMTQERALFVGGFLQIWYILASFLTVRTCPPSDIILRLMAPAVVPDRFCWSPQAVYQHGYRNGCCVGL
jgi:hypothetical protein